MHIEPQTQTRTFGLKLSKQVKYSYEKHTLPTISFDSVEEQNWSTFACSHKLRQKYSKTQYSQSLESCVQLHVYGMQSLQILPVLYVSIEDNGVGKKEDHF